MQKCLGCFQSDCLKWYAEEHQILQCSNCKAIQLEHGTTGKIHLKESTGRKLSFFGRYLAYGKSSMIAR